MNTANLFGRIRAAVVLIALGTSALYSCSVEKEIDSIGDPDEEGIEMVISVGAPGTRTDNSGNSTLWTEGDALSVFHSAAGQTTFWSSWFGFYYGNMFQGTVKKLSATNDWYAVYPWRENNTSPAQLHLSFASRQTQTGNDNKEHFAGDLFPMYGKTPGLARSEDLSISMSNVLSAAQIRVKNNSQAGIVVEEVSFTAESNIAGDFSVDLTGETPVIAVESKPTKTVTLTVEDGEEIAVGDEASFYVAFAPYEVPAGGNIQVKVVAVHPSAPSSRIFYYRTITVDNGTTFKSGLIKKVNIAFDEEHNENPGGGEAGEVDLEPGEQPEDGVYLLVYEAGENSMAFAPFADQKENKYAIPVDVVDGVVIPEAGQDLSVYAVTIEVATDESGNPITHSNDDGHYAYNVRNSEGQYVFYSTGGGTLDASEALQIKDINEMDIDGTTYKYYHTFVQATDGIQVLSSIYGASGGNKYLLAYSTSNGFYYEENNTGQKLHLYLLGGSAKEKQNPYFDPESVTYNFDALGEGTLTNKPTLKNARTSVTYSSNNTSVATVNKQNGDVTVHNPGTAIITATAAADETYYGATAQYTLEVTSNSVQTWYKTDEMVAGQTYLIVSNGYALQNNNGSIAATAVTVSNEVITMNAPSGIQWTATDGNGLKNNNQYLGSSSSSWSPSLSIGSNATAWTYNADGNTITFSSSSTWGGATTYYLYYSTSNSGGYTINSSSGDTHVAALYSTTKPLEKQNLSFDYSTIRWTVGEGGDHALNQSYEFPQQVKNAKTTVSYSSSNENVASISGNRILVNGIGSTTITATAIEENGYKEGKASYTLRISTPAPAGLVDLGPFNLENDDVKAYLDAAETTYTDDNYKTASGGSGTSIVSTYTRDARTRRMDLPKPVTIDWGTQSSGTTTITIFADQTLNQEVWVQTAASKSTSADVYNLVPGKTYYCTVEDDSGYLLKGIFTTEGRRRMMRVSTTQNQNNANNCRDLGGLKTTDGRRIKYGMIFRGTNLDGTKNKSIDNYVSPNNTEQGLLMNFMNVGYDIDLRAGGNSALPTDLVHYVEGEMDASLSDVTKPDKARITLQGFFDAAAEGKASYFHCAIGSDRTGFWGLLIEGLLGVSVKDCSIDFELTGFAGGVTGGDRPRNSTGYLFFQGMENSVTSSGSGVQFKGFSKYEGSTFQEKVANYVKTLSNSQYIFTDETIEAFRNAVLEDDPDQ